MGSTSITNLIGAFDSDDFNIPRDENGDAGAKINAALNYISSLNLPNGRLFLRPGTYRVVTSVVHLANIEVMGAGSVTIIKLGPSANVDVWTADTVTNIKLSNLVIDGNRANNTSGTRNGLWLSAVTDAVIENVEIRNCRYDGYRFDNCERVELRGPLAHDNGRHGISISYSRFNLLQAPRCYDNCRVTTAGNADGINFELLSGDNTIIAPVSYETSLAGQLQGYGIHEAAGEGCYRNIVIGGAEQGNKTAGMSLESRDSMAFTPDFVRYLTASVVNPT